MAKVESLASQQVLEAFKAYETQERFHNTKVGCFLVMTLMPLGIPMDYYKYPDHFLLFVQLRIWSAIVAGAIWASLDTKWGRRASNALGLVIPMVPVFFIAWMIAVTEGFQSPYYAGLNLVLLAVGAVLRWTFLESLVAVSMVLIIYVGTGLWNKAPADSGALATHFFFLVCMDIIVVVGTYFQYRGRLREFALRYELDQNRQILEQANQQLMELDQVKSRFFANISHELRTPLTLLLAPLDALKQRFGDSADHETGELLGTMQSNGMRLLKLINDLLDLVRLESGRMEVRREPLDVPEFINGLASATRQVAQDKGIRLLTWVDPQCNVISADHDKLEKVLLNLVFNALKFTPAGGEVEVRAFKQSDNLLLTVRDTGVGIAEKNLPFVFDRFWQADTSSKRKFQGTGIGLALVKELAELHGGNVAVESQEGKGTTFTVRLPFVGAEPKRVAATVEPVAKVETASAGRHSEEWLANLYRRAELFPANIAAAPVLPAGATNGSNLPCILVADDEPDMLRFLKSQLSKSYQVLEATNGQQAVDRARQSLPDIILLDMMMPEKDGLQACRELREATTTQKIPIIVLTAKGDDSTKISALSAGASDFLTKPFSTTELHVRIKNLVDSHGYQQTLARQNQVLENTITQLKETEMQLVQSEKMASLGRLSAGMIHEINNPLNFVTTGLFTLRANQEQVGAEHRKEYMEILSDLEEGIGRVRDLVLSLRMFSYADNEKAEVVPVAEVVAPALRFLGHEWRGKVEIHEELPAGFTVHANKNKLIQVMVNLLQNALDALDSKSFNGDKPAIWIRGALGQGKATIMVRDNGEGIDPDNMNKIFDPFFTTKDVGQGMGLGLSICYRIVQQYGGRIHVQSERGKYSEFCMEFPQGREVAADKN